MSALKAVKATKLKLTITMLGALALALSAGSALAQTPAAPAPGTQKPAPPAPAPARRSRPRPRRPPARPRLRPPRRLPRRRPRPHKPFPEGAKIAYVNVQAIASSSVEGKAATSKLEELRRRRPRSSPTRTSSSRRAQTKLQQGGSVLNDAARAQLDKDIEKMNREIQFAQQDANTELQELQNTLQADFQEKLNPILEQVATEKGLTCSSTSPTPAPCGRTRASTSPPK